MKTLCTLVLMYICLGSFAQPIQLKGTVKNGNRQPVEFANIVLQTADSVTGCQFPAWVTAPRKSG